MAHRAIRAHGVTIGIRATTAEALTAADSCLPPRWTPSKSRVVDRLYSIVAGGADPGSRVRRFHIVYADFLRLARSSDPDEGYRLLAADLGMWVAILAPRQVFLHAGVVAWRGRALVLPGRSYTGKSTLVAALVRAGATYYSDEWAVLDELGRVHPYARPLSIRGDGAETEMTPVEALGGRAGTKPLPVGLVVMTRFGTGSAFRPRPLAASEAALAMLEHAVQTHRDPARVLGAIRRVVQIAPVLTGPRGQADRVARGLLERLESGGRA